MAETRKNQDNDPYDAMASRLSEKLEELREGVQEPRAEILAELDKVKASERRLQELLQQADAFEEQTKLRKKRGRRPGSRNKSAEPVAAG